MQKISIDPEPNCGIFGLKSEEVFEWTLDRYREKTDSAVSERIRQIDDEKGKGAQDDWKSLLKNNEKIWITASQTALHKHSHLQLKIRRNRHR